MYEQRASRPVDQPSGSTTNLYDVSSMPRSGLVPSWLGRISWGAVFAGVFVAIALQFALQALALWTNFGIANLTSVAAIQSSANSIAVWTGVFAAISLTIGAFVAARLSGSSSVMSGIWHGIVVWGVGAGAMTILSLLGVPGLLGFGLSTTGLVRAIPSGAAVTGLSRTTAAVSTYSGYYLLFTGIAVVTSAVGGFVGTIGMRRHAVATPATTSVPEQPMEERRAA